jgi:hypothetical protein
MKTKTVRPLPVPVKSEQRICFGIDWYATEADAKIAAEDVKRRGRTYNGGFFHGKPCGRDTSWDIKGPSGDVLLFAVTN